jgi:hypothetical protein
MEIKINGKNADITIDNEKTVAHVMVGIEQWLSGSGHIISGLVIDGQKADSSSLDNIFAREIDTVKILDIITMSVTELSVMSLVNLLADIDEFEKLPFDGRNNFFTEWKESPQALFILEQMPDFFTFFENTFLKGVFGVQALRSITEERLREFQTPVDEFSNLRPLLEETCARLTDLPLDIQTGKDARASQTIQIFIGITEKIFRIYRQLELQGYIPKSAEEKNLTQQINDFNVAVKELLLAYEKNDTVLIGDLAEYEIAPRLQKLYYTAAGD